MSEVTGSVESAPVIRVLSAAEAAAAPLTARRRSGAGRPSPRLDAIRGLEVGGRVEFGCPPDTTVQDFRNTLSSSVHRKGAVGFPVSVQIVNDTTVAVTRRADVAPVETPAEVPAPAVADAPAAS